MKEVSFPTPHTPHPTPSFKSGDYFYLYFPHPTPYTPHPLSSQETGDRRLFLFILPTPYTLHPTPYTLHPTPHFTTRSSTIECSAKAIGY
ncbi:MAG: hypothetical protein GPJ07_07350 [Microcystis aeruginosa G13-07]|nr:hypothetical protein [Microcystis aeruginosa SX13-01]NCS06426.1 hypothetical protein [Microcystis aeruginosa G13-07]NCT45975.1 hypothetical protein [Microcystis aeruginosa G11-09]